MPPLDNAVDLPPPGQAGRIARKAAARKERQENRAKKAHPTRAAVPLTARNETQADFLEALRENPQVFAIGPAGTGKTYIASRWAIRQLLDGNVDRVFVARPTVAKAKHRLGALPGDQKEKLSPWLVPIMDAFKVECSATTLDRLQQDGQIEFLSFEHLRGRTLDNAVVVLDEAQNCDVGDLKLFLTRIGDRTQVIVSGDVDQVDITDSGLSTVLDMIDRFDMTPDVIEFAVEDVVRSATAKEWVAAFARSHLST